jgi:hypothetical protein
MNFVEQHAAEDRANTRDCLQPIQRVGVMVLGGFADAECDVASQIIVGADEGKIDCNPFLYRWIRTTLGDPLRLAL